MKKKLKEQYIHFFIVLILLLWLLSMLLLKFNGLAAAFRGTFGVLSIILRPPTILLLGRMTLLLTKLVGLLLLVDEVTFFGDILPIIASATDVYLILCF